LNKVQEKLEAAKTGLQNTAEDQKKYKSFKTTETVTKMEFEDTDKHSTFCQLHSSDNIVCHENCGVEFSGLGDTKLSECACMSKTLPKLCTKCGCGVVTHFHGKKKLVEKKVVVEKILHDVKAQFEHLSGALKDLKKDVDQWEQDLNMLQISLKDKHKQIRDLCESLKKICSRFNFVAELKTIIDMMKLTRSKVRSTHALKELDDSIKAIHILADNLNK